MESKDYLNNVYNVNDDCALKYAQQNNLPETKRSLQKAGEAIIKLINITYGIEKERYKAKAKSVMELLEKVNQKMSEPVQQPATPNAPAQTDKKEEKK